MRIAISGHRDLSRETAARVRSAIRQILQPFAGSMVGVSCLAPGSDQIFADVVLELGGRLEVIVPARRDGPRRSEPAQRGYDRWLDRATRVLQAPFDRPSPEAYASANVLLLEGVDVLLAVWDGQPARGTGGTAEVVRDALNRDIEVRIIWPEGSVREP